jgi:hypothetical protein
MNRRFSKYWPTDANKSFDSAYFISAATDLVMRWKLTPAEREIADLCIVNKVRVNGRLIKYNVPFSSVCRSSIHP